MKKLCFVLSLLLVAPALFLLATNEESWVLNQYRENEYVDNRGQVQNENLPVAVTIRHSYHDLGYGLLICGLCIFLSGVYLHKRDNTGSDFKLAES